MNYFITAIGTDSGKTLISSIITEYLHADYWKPIQCGFPRDTDSVKSLISNKKSKFHPEQWLLETPASPHYAAEVEGITIDLGALQVPKTSNHLIIEGAGGVMVPVNNHKFVIDLAKIIPCKIILVANLYLGSINHTLLTLDYLNKNKFDVAGIVFNGETNPSSENIIKQHSPFPVLGHVPQMETTDKTTIKQIAKKLNIV